MQGHILRIRDLGQNNFWRVLHEAAPESPHTHETTPAAQTGRVLFLQAEGATLADKAAALEASALLHSATDALGCRAQSLLLPSALCASSHMTALGSLATASADICAVHGLTAGPLAVLAAACSRPVLNLGNNLCGLDSALADLALMQSLMEAQGHSLDTLRVSWVGGVNGLAHSLMEAAIYAPIELFMAVPSWGEPDKDLTALALKAGAKIFLTREPHLALDGAHCVYAGVASPPASKDTTDSKELQAGFALSLEMLAHAQPGARMLAGTALHGLASRMDDTPPDATLEQQRLEYRLRAHISLVRLLTAVKN